MRIAQIAPLYEAVPPGLYGGTERVIAALCDSLVERGHDVSLFAADGSTTAAELESYGLPLRERMSRRELIEVAPHLHLQMIADVYRPGRVSSTSSTPTSTSGPCPSPREPSPHRS